MVLTTNHFGLILFPAPLENRVTAIEGKSSFRSFFKTFTAIFFTLRFRFLLFLAYDVLEGYVVSKCERRYFIWYRGWDPGSDAMNVILLGGYTFGCHSLRHLIGGWKR